MPMRDPRRPLLVVAIALAITVGAVVVAFARAPSTDVSSAASQGVQVGRVAPEIDATTIDGAGIALESLRGNPVWVTFGATWCAPCRVEAPDIQAVAARRQTVVVAVYVGEEPDVVRDFAVRLGLTYQHIADPRRELSHRFGVVGIPAHFFIDATGVVRSVRAGALGPEAIAAGLASVNG